MEAPRFRKVEHTRGTGARRRDSKNHATSRQKRAASQNDHGTARGALSLLPHQNTTKHAGTVVGARSQKPQDDQQNNSQLDDCNRFARDSRQESVKKRKVLVFETSP